ncbi:hypothetical protein VG1_CDS0067 [Arthrobacter phage Cupello]|nr:hypothetical protein VG1_CDS0067 [Arthrobacter phage Cupello]
MGAAVVKFMQDKFGTSVVVVDSLGDDRNITVLRADGALLPAAEAEALRLFLRGYRVFGGPS